MKTTSATFAFLACLLVHGCAVAPDHGSEPATEAGESSIAQEVTSCTRSCDCGDALLLCSAGVCDFLPLPSPVTLPLPLYCNSDYDCSCSTTANQYCSITPGYLGICRPRPLPGG